VIEIEFSIDVERPIEEVFAYLSDPAKVPEWDPRVVSVEQETDGPLGVGTRLRETRRMAGRKLEQVVEVAEYEPPRLFSLRIVSGPLPLDGRNRLEALDDMRTRVSFAGSGEPKGLARLAQPLVRRMVERQLRAHYGRIRERLEAA
jgi:uncharacterized protein YndB with AHSA1/START domain